jgi:hypothetical protein
MRSQARKRHDAPFVVIAVIFIALELWHSLKTMYNTFMAFAAGAVAIAFLRSHVIPLMLSSTLSSPRYIFFLLLSLLFLYPEFVHRFYKHPQPPRNLHTRSPYRRALLRRNRWRPLERRLRVCPLGLLSSN